jgi:solute carrier family 25 (mitochondrial S-adenosylmethionine transporter), member 26
LFYQNYRNATAIANRTLYRGLYQGVGTVALAAILPSGVFFITYEGSKRRLRPTALPSPVVHATSSGIAQIVNSAVMTPIEVLKQNTQMLVQSSETIKRGSPTLNLAKTLLMHPTRLWRGYTALLGRDIPFTVLQFSMYEHLKSNLFALRLNQEPTVFNITKISAASAGIAGCVAAWITTPFDVIKTRMMLQANSRLHRDSPSQTPRDFSARRRTVRQVYEEVFQTHGVRGLFRGGFVRSLYTIIGNGLFMGIYEGTRFYLDNRNIK